MLCWRCVLYKLTVFVFENDIGPKWLYLLFVLVFERCICICIWKFVLSEGEVVTRSTRTATIGAFPMKHLPQCSNFSTIYISNLQYHTLLVIRSKKSFCTISGILLNTQKKPHIRNQFRAPKVWSKMGKGAFSWSDFWKKKIQNIRLC